MASWENDEGWTDTTATVEKDGFDEEELNLWQDSATVSAYDSHGQLLEFRWVESGIYQGDSDENLLHENGTFTLTQDGQAVEYRVTIEQGGGRNNPHHQLHRRHPEL